MSYKIFLLAVIFIITSGSLFSSNFRNHTLLTILASIFAITSTYYLLQSVYYDLHSHIIEVNQVNNQRTDRHLNKKPILKNDESLVKENNLEFNIPTKIISAYDSIIQGDTKKSIVTVSQLLSIMKNKPSHLSALTKINVIDIPGQNPRKRISRKPFTISFKDIDHYETDIRSTEMRGNGSGYVRYPSYRIDQFIKEVRALVYGSIDSISDYEISHNLSKNNRRFLFITEKTKRLIILSELDPNYNIKASYNISSLTKILERPNQSISIPGILNIGDDIYFCVVNESFARNSEANSSFVVKLGLLNGKVKWISQAKVCRSEFTILNNLLVTSYGGSYHEDYIYAISTHNGEVVGKNKMLRNVDFLINVGGRILGTRYRSKRFSMKLRI